MAAASAPFLAAQGAAPPPVLTGPATPRQILKVAPEWKSGYEAYAPDDSAVARLRDRASRLGGDLSVEVVFGSWCGDSREHVPRFLKVRRLVGRGTLRATFVAVDRSKMDPARTLEGKDIQRVPTFIVTWKGVEIGRIVETPAVSVEADLAAILENPDRP
jgi:thiol-disulfide isomerase/thioredoxin